MITWFKFQESSAQYSSPLVHGNEAKSSWEYIHMNLLIDWWPISISHTYLKAFFSSLISWIIFKDVAEGFFLLLTQITLIYKVEKFYSNRHRIKACEKLLRSTLFRPKDNEEDAWVILKEKKFSSWSNSYGLFIYLV